MKKYIASPVCTIQGALLFSILGEGGDSCLEAGLGVGVCNLRRRSCRPGCCTRSRTAYCRSCSRSSWLGSWGRNPMVVQWFLGEVVVAWRSVVVVEA
jgi:hypothetical protein